MALLAFINLLLGLVLADRGAGFIAGATVIWGGIVSLFAAKGVLDTRKKAQKGAALAEANSSTMAWKSSVVNGGGASQSTTSASRSNGSSEMEMGKR